VQDTAAQIRDLQEELRKRDELLAGLQAENVRLRQLVVELRERLGQNSSNSSKPPSTDKPGSRPPRKPKRDKKKLRRHSTVVLSK